MNNYFVISSSCRVVKGFSRSLLIDYNRENLFFIDNQYADIFCEIDRKKISSIYNKIEDEESRSNFMEFIDFLKINEIGFETNSIDEFPKISDSIEYDDFTLIQDSIIEIHEESFNKSIFQKICDELTLVKCKDIQLRLLSPLDLSFLQEIINFIDLTYSSYIEVHATYAEWITHKDLFNIVEKNPLLNKIFIYSSPNVSKHEVINDLDNSIKISLGEINYLDYDFLKGQCCGIINSENLNFSNIYVHNKLKNKNGCLHKKISFDQWGNIKNCPSLNNLYGNILNFSIIDVLKNEKFKSFGDINKDQIEVCKICEFRYSCTDCRAFTNDSESFYSKPSKCSYNPITCEW